MNWNLMIISNIWLICSLIVGCFDDTKLSSWIMWFISMGLLAGALLI